MKTKISREILELEIGESFYKIKPEYYMHYTKDNNINHAHELITEDTIFDSEYMYFKTFDELKLWLFNKEVDNLKKKYSL